MKDLLPSLYLSVDCCVGSFCRKSVWSR